MTAPVRGINRMEEAARYADKARSKLYGPDYIHNSAFHSRSAKIKEKNGIAKTKTYLASGRFGDVYKIEKEGQPPYVQKVVYGHPDFVQQEVDAQATAAALGLAPAIHEWVIGPTIPHSGGVAKHKISMDYVDPNTYTNIAPPDPSIPGDSKNLGYDITRDIVDLGLHGGILLKDRHRGNMRRGPDDKLVHLDFGVTKKLTNKERIEGSIDTVAMIMRDNGQAQEAAILEGLKDEMMANKDYKGAYDLAHQASNILQIFNRDKMTEIKNILEAQANPGGIQLEIPF